MLPGIPHRIALNSTDVIALVSEGVGRQYRVEATPKSGGPARVLAESRFGVAIDLVADDRSVTWDAYQDLVFCEYGAVDLTADLLRSSLDATVSTLGSADSPGQLARDEDFIYLRSVDHTHGETGCGRTVERSGHILKVPAEGGPAVVLAADQTPTGSLAADADYVYFGNEELLSGGELRRVSKNGGNVEVMYPATPARLTIGGGRLYFASGGRLLSLDRSGRGAPIVLADDIGDDDIAIAVDSAAVYWTRRFGSGGIPPGLYRVGLDGTGRRALETSSLRYTAVAVDEQSVFYAREDGIRRLAK